jgi:DNA-binding beta-propeller fold protein YncE
MPCALTSNYTLDCRDSNGGVVELYFIEAGNVSSVTEASGTVTAITKATGKVFRKYEQEQETAFFVENLNSSVANGTIYYNQELTIVVNKMQVALRNELLLLAKNRLMAVVKDANGSYWLLGKTRSLKATAGSSATGTATGDRNGYTFTFTAPEPALAPEVSSACAATLQTAGA